MNHKIPIITCIDVEPDDRMIDAHLKAPWRGFEETFFYMCRLRDEFAKIRGHHAQFSWFFRMDPQIEKAYGSPAWPVEHYGQFVDDLREHGDEIGLHPHTYRFDTPRQAWITDHGNQEWVDHCIQMAFAAFQNALARPCESFRSGDRWLNNETVELVEKLGARFDLTLEPGQGALPALQMSELFTGSIPDYTAVPQVPFRPSKADFRKPDVSKKDGIWMIPLSGGKVVYQFGRLEKLYRQAFCPHTMKPAPKTLNLMLKPRAFAFITNELLAALEKPYLAIVLRSDIAIRKEQMQNMEANFEFLMDHPLSNRFVFATPRHAMTLMGYLEKETIHSQSAKSESPEVDAAEDLSQAPIFILGVPRSGTTLLSFILDSHPNIAVGRETQIFRSLEYFFGDKEFEGEDILEAMLMKEWYKRYMLTREELASYVRKFINSIFSDYAKRWGKKRWGEKTPVHIRYCKLIYEIFPSGQFIHIVRDPRAICASRKIWEHPIERSARQWYEENEMLFQFSKTIPERNYCKIRYEDLVTNKEAVLRHLISFLGEEWSDNLLNHERFASQKFVAADREGKIDQVRTKIFKDRAVVEGGPRNDPARPIDMKSLDKWKKSLRKIEIARIQQVAGEGMKQYGYKMAKGLIPLIGRLEMEE